MKVLLKKEVCGSVNNAWNPLEKYKTLFSKKKKGPKHRHSMLSSVSKQIFSVCLVNIKKSAYFTIQLIFVTIHDPHCTF